MITIISSCEVCWIILKGLFEFVQKNCRCSVWINLMHRNKIFLNIYLIYIKNFTLLKEFSSMWQYIFIIYNSEACSCWLYIFFKVCLGWISPCNISVVKVGMHVRMIQWQKQMFIYIGLCLIQQPNIFSNFTFYIFFIFNVFFLA